MAIRTIAEIISGAIGILLLLFIINLSMTTLPQAGSKILSPATSALVTPLSGDISDLIMANLSREGVPVKEVKTISTSPMEVNITVQSASDNSKATPEDVWYQALSDREAALAFLNYGKNIDTYGFTVVNKAGEIIMGGGSMNLDALHLDERIHPAQQALIGIR